MRFIDAHDRVGLAHYLLGFIQRLAAARAEFAVIPAVNPHYCIHELKAISPLPVIDIAAPLANALASRSIRRAALFGTRYVMESDFYSLIPGVEFVHPHPAELEAIHTIYVELAESHHATPQAHARLTAIAKLLCIRDLAEAVILAGTDLALLINESNTEFPAIDCAALTLRRSPSQHYRFEILLRGSICRFALARLSASFANFPGACELSARQRHG